MAKRLVRFSFNRLLVVLFVLFLAAVFLIVQGRMNPDQVPSLFGYHPLTVLSNSMEPEFSAGDMVIAKQVNPETIETGDVITYYDEESQIITHRVIETTTESGEAVFQTQGDNNNVEDDYVVAADQVIGTVNFSLPYGGYVAEFLRSPLGMVLFIIIPVCTFVGITIYERLGKDEESEQSEQTI
ncbi:signal peptidase I [Alteribacillus bidgolensis]|uniref:Signal peptidase I n=1 Tax=Alteribacillus bidgolensis TaxID=930129 RepID=A0A1G8L4G8_9BACI|nr:signal peptidase I [Alteribacillus bidgolensis]SDI50594.1 Signal peptidase I Serine peptidase. MEROPS family S26B [Alteribacillus bidgolensis]